MVPQGLKPRVSVALIGTAEALPSQSYLDAPQAIYEMAFES